MQLSYQEKHEAHTTTTMMLLILLHSRNYVFLSFEHVTLLYTIYTILQRRLSSQPRKYQ